MTKNRRLCVKLIHCGNRNIANPDDNAEKSIFFIPMGLFPLADKLKKNGVDIEIINLDLETGSIEDILDFGALDAVGLDCHWINQALAVVETAALIKKIKPSVFIFIGGYSASFFSEEILTTYSCIDAVIRGDAEIPILELCRKLEEPPGSLPISLEGVGNLTWRNHRGEIMVNKFVYTANSEDMNALEYADMELLRNWKFYRDLCKFWTRFSPYNRVPVFFLEVGRGCKYNCSFCGGNSLAQACIGNRQEVAVRSVDSVIETIKKAVAYGYSLVFPSFEFAGSDPWYSRLFRKIKEEKIKVDFVYGSWGLPGKFLVDELSACFENSIIEVSPETADHILRKKNKDMRIYYSNQELEEILDHIDTKPNVKIQIYFGYFLAYETEETVFTTLNYIARLIRKYSRIAEVLYLNLSTDPASLLYLDPKRYDVEISVRCFNDYIEALKDAYIERSKESQLNMTLFRPADMSPAVMEHLARKIELFKRIFAYFGRSAALLMDRDRHRDYGVNIISDYIREFNLAEIPTSRFTPGFIKDVLFDICRKYNLGSTELTRTIHKEYQDGRKGYVNVNISGSTREIKVVSQQEKERIRSTIHEARQEIEADFDI